MSEAKETKKAPAKKKAQVVFFIGDAYREDKRTGDNPIENTIDKFLDSNPGKEYQIYVQSRYGLDQTKLRKPVQKAVISVYKGDVVPALRQFQTENAEAFNNVEIAMTVQGIKPKGWFKDWLKGIKYSQEPPKQEEPSFKVED